jgi:pimeloyl-ACP methyl ester carboxylesterase
VTYRVAALISLTLTALLAGCSHSTYAMLVSEQDIPALKRMLDQRPTLTLNHVPTFGATGKARLDVGVWEEAPESERLTIMIHGVLANSNAWRFVSGPLSDDADLMLIDLPGCGASDARPPFKLKQEDPAGYETGALGFRVAEAIHARLDARHTPPERIAIVAHSLGALVTLRLLADTEIAPDHREWIDKVDRIVLISPVDLALPYGPPSLERVATIPWLRVEFGELTGILKEQIARGARQTVVDPDIVPREQVDSLLAIVADAHRRSVAQDMLKSVIPTVVIDDVYYPDWDRTECYVEAQRTLKLSESKSTLLIVGERDEDAPSSMAYKLATELPNPVVLTMARTKHSPHIEHAALTARIIDEFINDARTPDIGERSEHTIAQQRVIPDE